MKIFRRMKVVGFSLNPEHVIGKFVVLIVVSSCNCGLFVLPFVCI